jgi:acetoin utilization deacetylase AcuC-like enzyme
MLTSIPVFFTPLMVADSASMSPSARKPQYVVDRWKAKALPFEVREPAPLTKTELSVAHHPAFVDGVLSCRTPNGFGNLSREVAAALPYTSGAMYAAAISAIKGPSHVACAPVSGFHHAGYSKSQGYCTFNGLIITAMLLLQRGIAKRVGILDIDAHYGNGTDELIGRHRLGDRVEHWTFGQHATSPYTAGLTLHLLKPILEVWKERGCEVVLYQAGADPHIDDPHGGFLTDEELRKRDEIVFTTTARLGLPIAWNLAGGYQQKIPNDHGPDSISPVLDIHEATMRECVKIYAGG